MSIKTIIAKQDPTKVTLAHKLEVRELEEHGEKGNFIAFVDEGPESYDVNITVEGSQVRIHTCDCAIKDTYCVHQLAVLLQLNGAKKNTPTTKRVPAKRKMKESGQLLQDADPQEVSSWLTEIFKANKDIELQFVLRFSKQPITYQPEDISKLLNSGITAVIGKRKKLEAVEIKKIIDIWEKSLVPVWDYIQANITKPEGITIYIAMVSSLYDFEHRYHYSSTRIRTLLSACYDKLGLILSLVTSDLQWQSLFNWLWTETWREGTTWVGVFPPIQSMYSYLSPERKSIFANTVLDLLIDFVDENVAMPVEVDNFFLDVMLDSGRFDEIYFYFEPKKWQHEYNLKLARAVRLVDPEVAIQFCSRVIDENVQDSYNLPFLNIMEEVFVQLGDLDGQACVKMDMFSWNPNIEDYKFIMQHAKDEADKIHFRSRVLTNHRYNLDRDEEADLYFSILVTQKNYKNMLEVIDYNIGAYPLLKYWDYMYNHDRMALVKKIANNFNVKINSNLVKENELIDKLKENYDIDTLKQLFKPNDRSTYLVTLRGLLYDKLGQP